MRGPLFSAWSSNFRRTRCLAPFVSSGARHQAIEVLGSELAVAFVDSRRLLERPPENQIVTRKPWGNVFFVRFCFFCFLCRLFFVVIFENHKPLDNG
jgi:hypothetical protein